MDWFLGRFRSRQKGRATPVCYLRENGPIAYGADMFGADARERADAMLSTGLAWYWKASGHDAVARDWTHLTRWSLAALLEDLEAEHAGMKSRVLLVAVEGDDAPEDISDAIVAASMRKFGTASNGPLHAVATRPASGSDLLFVAQQPPESIRELLQAWGIDRDKAQRRSYARLNGNALEDVIRSLG